MKVFISWSGDRSKHIAMALREWLPGILQFVDPFASPQDIDSGTRWNAEISGHLELANVGILCLTPENLLAPWLLFEAGALSKLGGSRVIPVLFDLESRDVEPPLSQFNHVAVNKAGVRTALESINRAAGDKGLQPTTLAMVFQAMWPKLEADLERVPARPTSMPPRRPDGEVLNEILDHIRSLSRLGATGPQLTKRSLVQLLRQDIDHFASAAMQFGATQQELQKIDGLFRTVDSELVMGIVPSALTLESARLVVQYTTTAMTAREGVPKSFEAEHMVQSLVRSVEKWQTAVFAEQP